MVATTTDVAQVKVRRPVGLPEAPERGWRARATRWRWMAAPAALALGVRVISLLLADLALRMLVAVGVLAPSRYLGLIESWRVYDAVWYMHIAQLGYDAAPPRNLVTFFPLYPLLIRSLGAPLAALGVPDAYLLAAMLVSWAAFTAACVLLYRLALPRLGHIGALSAVALLALFPFAFFFGAAYSESVFLLAAVGVFFAVERQRWATAAIIAAFAGALRPPGVLLGLAVAIAYGAHLLHEGRRPDRAAFWLALMPAGQCECALHGEAVQSHALRALCGARRRLPGAVRPALVSVRPALRLLRPLRHRRAAGHVSYAGVAGSLPERVVPRLPGRGGPAPAPPHRAPARRPRLRCATVPDGPAVRARRHGLSASDVGADRCWATSGGSVRLLQAPCHATIFLGTRRDIREVPRGARCGASHVTEQVALSSITRSPALRLNATLLGCVVLCAYQSKGNE